MPKFETGWALIVRDWTPVDGQEADNVSVLRVYASKEEALREADRLRREHAEARLLPLRGADRGRARLSRVACFGAHSRTLAQPSAASLARRLVSHVELVRRLGGPIRGLV